MKNITLREAIAHNLDLLCIVGDESAAFSIHDLTRFIRNDVNGGKFTVDYDTNISHDLVKETFLKEFDSFIENFLTEHHHPATGGGVYREYHFDPNKHSKCDGCVCEDPNECEELVEDTTESDEVDDTPQPTGLFARLFRK